MRAFPGCLAALLLLPGCATTHGQLSYAARDLDQAADGFYQEVRDERVSRELAQDAADFADAARDFTRAVDRPERGADLHDEFHRLQEEYHEVRAEVQDAHALDRDEREDFDRLTEAYLDVEQAVSLRRDDYYDVYPG